MSILHIPHLPCLLASVFLHVQLLLDSVNEFCLYDASCRCGFII